MSRQADLPTDFIHVSAKGILGLRTNLKNFRWSFGQQMPLSSPEEFAACRVRIRVRTAENAAFADAQRRREAEQWGKYHYLTGAPGEDLVLYERSYLFGMPLLLTVEGMAAGEPVLTVNPAYRRFVHYRFMNLHSVNFLLTDLTAISLLRAGLAPLHCSAFKSGKATVVVIAPGNTGKTLTTMLCCLEHGASFIAEDIAITDGKTVHSVPWTSTFGHYEKVDRRWLPRFLKRVNRFLPIVDLLPIARTRSITDYVPPERMCAQSEVTHLVILERGPQLVRSEDRPEAVRKIYNLNRAEFQLRNSVPNACDYFNAGVDITGAADTELRLIKTLVERATDCVTVRTPNPLDYPGLVLKAVS